MSEKNVNSIKKFLLLNKKFSSFLSNINSLLEKNKIFEAMSQLDLIKKYTSEIDELKKNLPEKISEKHPSLVSSLVNNQEEITSIAQKTEQLLSVHVKIANQAIEYAKKFERQKIEADSVYNGAGTISINTSASRPISLVREV